jgi:four helix bundle protein
MESTFLSVASGGFMMQSCDAERAEEKKSISEKVRYFDYERWDVYQAALQLIVVIKNIVEGLPRGNAYLADQLQRAGTSVPLNIAEGAGEHSASEKARFYRMAKRSATECASILDVCKQLQLLNENLYARGRELLLRIVAMLTKMARADNASSVGSIEKGFGFS